MFSSVAVRKTNQPTEQAMPFTLAFLNSFHSLHNLRYDFTLKAASKTETTTTEKVEGLDIEIMLENAHASIRLTSLFNRL